MMEKPQPQSPTLSSLPRELIIDIFKCLASPGDAKALLSTNAAFNSIWKDNVKTITESILPRAIPCYDDARVLRDVQKLGQGVRPLKSDYDGAIDELRAVITNSRIAEHSRNKYSAYHYFQSRSDPTPAFLDAIEEARFLRSYYRLCTFVDFHNCPESSRLRREFLIHSTITEQLRMSFIASWLAESHQNVIWRWGLDEITRHWPDLRQRWMSADGFDDRARPFPFRDEYLSPPSNASGGISYVNFHISRDDQGKIILSAEETKTEWA